MRINSSYYKVSQSAPTEGAQVSSASQAPSQQKKCDCEDNAVTVSLSSSSQSASSEKTHQQFQTYNRQAVINSGEGEIKEKTNDESGTTEEDSSAEKEEIRKLKARDTEVKQHEQTHAASLGPYKSGGPKYTYETGPDGKRYATGGSVPVDLSPEQKPEQTMRKMQTIKRAAMAPSEPSSSDKQIASQATQIESQARAQVAEEKQNSAIAKTETDLSKKDDYQPTTIAGGTSSTGVLKIES